MKGMKSCSKCKGSECKGGKGCMKEEKSDKGSKIEIEISLPIRNQRSAKAKKK